MYTLTQVICLIYAFVSIGEAVNKENSKFDKLLGLIGFIASVVVVLSIQAALKA